MQEKHSSDQSINRGRHQPRRFVSLVEQLHREIHQRRTQADHERPHEAPLVGVTQKLVRVTWALVFVGVCSLGVGLLQWDSLNRTDETTRKALVDVQRAFVFVRELQFKIRPGNDPTNPGRYPELWWFAPIIENSGNTPTKILQTILIAYCTYDPLNVVFGLGARQGLHCADIPQAGPPDPEDDFRSVNEKSTKIITTTLGPKGSISISGVGVPPFYIEDTQRAGKTFHYYGVMHYTDIFDTAHITKFCYNIGFNRTAADKSEPNIEPCDHWNCIEEQCNKDREQYNAETKDFIPQAIIILPPAPPAQLIPPLPGVLPEVPRHKL